MELSRHIVRIDRTDGRLLGTGFFVAPGVVFTAAHVTWADGAPLETVRATPGSADVGREPVLARVVARSSAPQESSIWPFPDVAILELEPESSWVNDHPCVWLAERDPSGFCHALGYPVVEPGVEPTGAPVQFEFDGRRLDRYLQLRTGNARRGLSGAPLICLTQRGVVGIMTATRDEYQAIGGWAAPVFDLAQDFPGVPPDLARRYPDIRGRNRQAVLRDRMRWHRVLPIDGAQDALRRPWSDSDFRRGDGTLPTEMLVADAGVVPFLFHDEQLADAREWCDRPTDIELRQFTGLGGAGKTRWAIELCRAMADRGWVVGFWHGRDLDTDVVDIMLPRLIVIDYVETLAPQELRDILEKLRKRATHLAPVRVVLLTRTGGTAPGPDLWREVSTVADADLRRVLGAAPRPSEAARLGRTQRARLYQEAFIRLHAAWHGTEPESVRTPSLRSDRYSVPLEVLFEALDQVLSGGTPSGTAPPADRALDHEQRHWPAGPDGVDGGDLRLAVSLATIAGADDADAADNLLTLIPTLAGTEAIGRREAAIEWLRDLYGGTRLINPLRPDRLGEALVANVLAGQRDQGHRLLADVLSLRDDRQIARALDLLARLVTSNPRTLDVVAKVASERHAELAERATRQARGTAGHPGVLDIALGLQRLYSDALADRLTDLASAADDDGTALLALAMSYNRTGDLAADSGRGDLADRLYRRALRIRESLWESRQSDLDLTRELSISVSRLGDMAMRTSQRTEAKELYERARQLRQRLVEQEPGSTMYARDLARAYDRWADVVADQVDAEQHLQQGLAIRQKLVRESPGNPKFSRDLAMSYDKLGDLASQRGHTEEARRLYEKGLAIREQLHAIWPDDTDIARTLSNSYDRLGDWHADNQDYESARSRYEQAMQTRETLSEAQPGNRHFARDVAHSFNRLGLVAAAMEDYPRATELFTEGLTRVQQLAGQDRRDTTLAQDAAVFLTNLGDMAEKDEQTQDDAQTFYHRGLEAAQRLLALEPDNVVFARDVANCYAGLSNLVGSPSAETLLSAAVHFRRTIHERQPERVDLAEELGHDLLALAEMAQPPERQRLTGEIDALLQRYAADGRLRPSGLHLWTEARQLGFK